MGIDKNGGVMPCLPCSRCKRILINAGIKQVVTMEENGNITKYDVKDWIEEDSKAYIDSLKKIKGQN